MPNEHSADPTPPPHHGQGRGGSKKGSFSLRVSPALHPPEDPPHVAPTWPVMALVGRRGNEHNVGSEYYDDLYDGITNLTKGSDIFVSDGKSDVNYIRRHNKRGVKRLR